MKTKSLTLAGILFFATATLALAATNDLTTALQKGLFEEEANHNLDAAIAAYQSVATQFDKDTSSPPPPFSGWAKFTANRGRPTRPARNTNVSCGNSPIRTRWPG